MQILKEIILILGGGGVLIAAAAWLARELYTQFLNKELERHKEQLRLESELKLAEINHGFERMKLEHEVRFSALHELRFKNLHDLHLKACKLSELLFDAIKPAREGREERFRAAMSAIGDARTFLFQVEIFLPKEFAESWSGALHDAFVALHRFSETTSWETSDWADDRKRLAESVDLVIASTKTFQQGLMQLARDLIEKGG